MKKFLLLIVALVATGLSASSAAGYDFTEAGLRYSIHSAADKQVWLAGMDDSHDGVVDVPKTVTHAGITYDVVAVSNNAFEFNEKITRVSLPTSVTEIGYWAFISCPNLTTVFMSYGVTTIGMDAFTFCTSLKEVYLPITLKVLSARCFKGCSALEHINIPASVTTIQPYVFLDCTSLKSVMFGWSGMAGAPAWPLRTDADTETLEIGNGAFSGCSALADIYCVYDTPPTASPTDCFKDVNLSTCKLWVPEGKLAAYQAAPVWKDFLNITEKNFGGVDGIDSQAVPYTIKGNRLTAVVSIRVDVYTADGRHLLVRTLSPGDTLDLPSGLLIVRAGSSTARILTE